MKDEMSNSLQAILWAIFSGGAAAGAADIVSAFGTQKGRVLGVLQYIGSGLIGSSAFDGGWATAVVGLAVHFGLTTIMAALFVLAAQRWTVLLQRPWPAGLVYGALLYGAMFYVIVPHLSAAQGWKTPQGFWSNLGAAMGHGFFVGVPIASVARHFLGQEQRIHTPLRMRASESSASLAKT
jgi:uncharacterized membrane protein YagU involved in acid resistance